MQLLLQALELTAQGHGVRLLAQQADRSTGEAADALGVSRPHLVLLLERGEIPFHRVGSHRRVRYGDVLAYRVRLDAQLPWRAFRGLTRRAAVNRQPAVSLGEQAKRMGSIRVEC